MPTCNTCRSFYTSKGKCDKSTGLKMNACSTYAEGRPFQPKFNGKKLNEVKFDRTIDQAWAFWVNDTTVLILMWAVDHNDYGHFRVFMLGMDDNGVITKQYSAGTRAPAFLGEVVAKGPGLNDVWSSFGFEDADIVDHEGNITNKPREIKIYPSRTD
jgi:hypothetical protein